MGIVVDTAIGMMLIFFLFSLLASALQELIAATWNSRGKMLRDAVIRLLDNRPPGSRRGSPASESSAAWSRHAVAWLARVGAAILPAGNAEVDKSSLGGRVLYHGLLSGLFRGDRPPSYIPADRFAGALLDTLRLIASDATITMDGMRYAIERLPAGQARTALASMLAGSSDVTQFGNAVAGWYSDTMDRVSGWYVRHVRAMLLLIGLALAVGMNADVFYIAGRISKDSTLRDSLVQRATTIVATGSAAAAPPGTAPGDIAKQINTLGIPIGWPPCNFQREDNGPSDAKPSCKDVTSFGVRPVLQAGIGWLLMALAISMGAPFWFDLLQNILQLRGTGVKPNGDAPDATSAPPTNVAGVPEPAAATTTVQDGARTDFESTNLSPHDIRLIQSRIGTAQSGTLDAATRTAITSYQRRKGFLADGTLTEHLVGSILGIAVSPS